MSAVIDDHAHDHAHDHHPTGLKRYLTTTNHKDIGTMYLWFSFSMFMVGGVMAMVLGALQFVGRLRAAYPRVHRWIGRIYLLGMLVGIVGASGLVATSPAPAPWQQPARAQHRRRSKPRRRAANPACPARRPMPER